MSLGTAGLQNVVDLARVVIAGKADAGQNLFFGLALFAVLGIVVGIAIAVRGGDTNQLVWIFLAFAGVLVLLIVMMAGLMRAGGGPVPPAGGGGGMVDVATLQALRAECDHLKGRLRRIYLTCEEIFHQLNVTPRNPVVLDQEVTLTVSADGSLVGSRTTVVAAQDHPQQMIVEQFVGDEPVDSVEALDLHSTVDQGKLVYLVAEDGRTMKKVLFFFLPEIDPSPDPAAPADRRTYTITWKWPKLWQPLLRDGFDTWRELVTGRGPVRRIRIRFRLDPSLPHIRLENPLGYGGGQQTVHGTPDQFGFKEYLWEMSDVRPGGEVVIRLTRH